MTQERYRHKKRGTEYTVVANGRVQGELTDEAEVVIYRGDDGQYWVRGTAEFHDGRFEPVSTRPAPDMAAVVEALEWYGEQARLCRLIHGEGDEGRHNLQADGGNKARAALQSLRGQP